MTRLWKESIWYDGLGRYLNSVCFILNMDDDRIKDLEERVARLENSVFNQRRS